MAYATQMTLTTEHHVLLREGDDPQKDEVKKDEARNAKMEKEGVEKEEVETGANEMQSVRLSVTYALEGNDRDVPLLAIYLAAEIAQAHRAAAQVLRACAFAPPPRSAAAYKGHSAYEEQSTAREPVACQAEIERAGPERNGAEMIVSESEKLAREASDDDSGDDELELDDPFRPEDQDEEAPSESDASEGDVSRNDGSDDIFDVDLVGEGNPGEEACESYSDSEYPGKQSDRAFADRQAPSCPDSLLSRPSLGQAIGDVISVSTAPSRSPLPGASKNRGMRKDQCASTDPHVGEEWTNGPPITHPQKIAIRSLARQIGIAHYELTSVLYQQFGWYSLERLNKAQAHDLHVALQQAFTEKEIEKAKEPQEQSVPSRNGHTVVAAG